MTASKRETENKQVADCYICGKKGHYSDDCWPPQKGVQRTPHRTHTRALFLAAHARTPDVITHSAQGLTICLCASKKQSTVGHVPLRTVSSYFSSLATSLTTPAASPALSTGIRPNPCATSLGDGLPGRLVDPIPNTEGGKESNGGEDKG